MITYLIFHIIFLLSFKGIVVVGPDRWFTDKPEFTAVLGPEILKCGILGFRIPDILL